MSYTKVSGSEEEVAESGGVQSPKQGPYLYIHMMNHTKVTRPSERPETEGALRAAAAAAAAAAGCLGKSQITPRRGRGTPCVISVFGFGFREQMSTNKMSYHNGIMHNELNVSCGAYVVYS